MINKIMVAAVAWLSMTAVFPIYAQQPKTHTLGNLWPKVEANYPGVGARTTAIDAAEFRERAAKSNMLPQINAQAQNSYGTYEGSAGAFFPQAGFFNVSGATDAGNASTMVSNSFGSATVTWELFSFGRRHKENKAANALFHQSVSDKDAYLISLKKTLSERYINLLYNLAKLNWAKENAQRLNEIRKVTAGLSAAGLKPAADSLLASSAYVQAKGEHDKWQGLEQAASIYLQELFSGESVDLNISPNRLIRPTASLSFGKKAMARSHPVLDVLDQQARYYSLMGQVQTKSRLPSLRFLGGYAFRGTAINPEGTASEAWKDGFNNPTNNVLVGVGITWNITGLHTHRLKSQAYFKEAERADF
ncbi:MAG TPA: TolC family protein, partial [Cyclobacteriaceae bacterium]|nr:TolC family protein [Cyclobacteriaceae bacterium]